MKICPQCGEAPSKNQNKGGLCGADIAWHYATRDLSIKDLAGYAERFKLRYARAGARLPILRGRLRSQIRQVK